MNNLGWLIYSKQDAIDNDGYIQWFIQEAKQQDLTLKLILREHLQIGILKDTLTILVDQKPTELPSFAVVRTVEPLLNLQLEELGIKVFNSSEIARICNHKALTHSEVGKLHIPMPDTLFFKKNNLDSFPPLSFPFVLKEATGRGGKQVYFINNQTDWDLCRTNLKSSDVIIQESNVQLGKDVRVFVVGREIVGSVLRESKTDFRANYKLGGSASWYDLTEKETEIVNKIVRNFDFGMVGIDFLMGHNGNLLFNEIEDIVGSRTLSAVSDINILRKYTTHIKNRLSENFS